MKLAPEDIAYLQEQARQRGYSGDDLLRVIKYESSGDPARWGGKGGKYFGLIQFGGPERQQFGVDTVHPNARNQIDAAFKFLTARGFKPGMGLLDLYSTVNAGSPGHYNASDRPGATVASHVAKMMGSSGAAPMSPATPTPIRTAEAPAPAQAVQTAPAPSLQGAGAAVPGLMAFAPPANRVAQLLAGWRPDQSEEEENARLAAFARQIANQRPMQQPSIVGLLD